MQLKKLRWSRVYESSEEELVGLLQDKNIIATRNHVNEMVTMDSLSFERETTWWCVDGSMLVASISKELSLQAGDFVHIPAHSIITAMAGITGCTYYES